MSPVKQTWLHTYRYVYNYCYCVSNVAIVPSNKMDFICCAIWDGFCKKLPVKANLAIYSPVSGVSVECWSVAFMLSYKLDFNSCVIRDSFCKSSHIKIIILKMHVSQFSLNLQWEFRNYCSLCMHQKFCASDLNSL